MRLATVQAAVGSASILFSTQPVYAAHGHRHAHDLFSRRETHNHGPAEVPAAPKAPRGATCSLPDHPDLVHVPGAQNNGFAMSPDQPCADGTWCPIACVSGKVMAQWKPNTRYVYPQSMYGGLYCNGGELEKPFPDAPYCVDGTGGVQVVNKAGSVVSFCQTVLPGNEAMLIPTDVTDTATLAVPGPDYWAGTAAHYYVNPPGIASSKGCVWGTINDPFGNWSPYVAGANTVTNGDTYVKIAWNPEFISAPLAKTTPTFGLRIECPGGGCNGLPCSIDPSKGGVGGLNSPVGTTGVGGANFCVVTVPKGKSANIVVFNTDGSQGSPSPSPSPAPSSKSSPPPAPTSTSSSSIEKPSSSSSRSTSSSAAASSTSMTKASSSVTSASPSTSSAFIGGLFQEQSVQGQTTDYTTTPSATPQPPASTTATGVALVSATPSNEGAVAEGGSAIAGLVVALVAAAAMI